jgi:hypothetical protein
VAADSYYQQHLVFAFDMTGETGWTSDVGAEFDAVHDDASDYETPTDSLYGFGVVPVLANRFATGDTDVSAEIITGDLPDDQLVTGFERTEQDYEGGPVEGSFGYFHQIVNDGATFDAITRVHTKTPH